MKALESLCGQSICRWECMVVDDASTDQVTLDVLKSIADPRVRVVHHAVNRGLAASRNTGIGNSSAPVIFPLDCDDELPADAVVNVISAFAARPDVDLFYPDYERFGEENEVVVTPEMDFPRMVQRHFPLATSPFRRVAWEKVGGLCEDEIIRLGMEDVEFHYALLESGAAFAHLPKVIYRYRTTPHSLSDRMQLHNYRIRRFIADRHRSLLQGYLRQEFLQMGAIRSYRVSLASGNKQSMISNLVNIIRHSLWSPRMWWRAAWNIYQPLKRVPEGHV